ncbi:MAG: DUF4912 domain-containing protein [Verrucomicrobiota bacterium]
MKTATAPAKVARKKITRKPADAPIAAPAIAAKPAIETPAPRKLPIPKAPVVEPPPKPARRAPVKIPAILLEGDQPETPQPSGPGQRYSLGPTPSVEKLESEGELPSAYGTQQLLLAARDPHWVYAHWDLTDAQLRHFNSLAADRHLILRLHLETISPSPVHEIHLHPESRHWFAHVDRAGSKYLAELGYRRADNQHWVTIATSGATITPPDAMSEDTSAEFASIPFEIPMAKLLALVKEAVQENLPLAEALQAVRAEEHPELPEFPMPLAAFTTPFQSTPPHWTAAQEKALAEIISMDHVRRVWMGSLEITELIRRQAVQELAAISPAPLGAPTAGAPTSPMEAAGAVSSPAGGAPAGEKGFWFNVNAELIIYGATESTASVTIAGRKIRLRPDGSFSYRFALPDGQYELPVVAVSADHTDGRAAELIFSRSTEYRGDVGMHPQSPDLKRPDNADF